VQLEREMASFASREKLPPPRPIVYLPKREPIRAWTQLALEARALLLAGALAVEGRARAIEGRDRDIVFALCGYSPAGSARPVITWELVLQAANRWLNEYATPDLHLGFYPENVGQPYLTLTPSCFRDYLALDLIRVLASRTGPQRCDRCGLPYARERRTKLCEKCAMDERLEKKRARQRRKYREAHPEICRRTRYAGDV
jgi:hypothetical protein